MSATAKRDAFRIERARALEYYVRTEQELAALFSFLLDIRHRMGGQILYKITNANARDRILETLLKEKLNDRHHKYWHGDDRGGKGVFHHLRSITQDRNSIVHWAEAAVIDGKVDANALFLPEPDEIVLLPPNWWDWGEESKQQTMFSIEALRAFVAKTYFVQQSVFMFSAVHFTRYLSAEQRAEVETWRGIFELPCSYPPHESHPKHALWQELATPPFRPGTAHRGAG